MRDKVDAIGTSLNVDDYVVRTGTHKGLHLTVVLGFSPVMVKTRSGLEYPQDLLVLTPEQAKRFKKHL